MHRYMGYQKEEDRGHFRKNLISTTITLVSGYSIAQNTISSFVTKVSEVNVSELL